MLCSNVHYHCTLSAGNHGRREKNVLNFQGKQTSVCNLPKKYLSRHATRDLTQLLKKSFLGIIPLTRTFSLARIFFSLFVRVLACEYEGSNVCQAKPPLRGRWAEREKTLI